MAIVQGLLLGDLTDDEATGYFEPGIVAFSERRVDRELGRNLWRGPAVDLVPNWDNFELARAADVNWFEDPSTSSEDEDPFENPFLPEY